MVPYKDEQRSWPGMPTAKKQLKRSFDDAFGPEHIYKNIPLTESKSIRLLRLHAGSGDDLLEGNLIIAEYHERYEALSYTWGDHDQESFIRILSEGNAHKMPITPNLKAALRQLRDPEKFRLLWIDALCINQRSEEEKSLQVPKMAGIYTRAFNVCIWLGEEYQSSDLAVSFIKRILNLDDFDRLVRDENSDKEWAALFDLMRRPWFTRRWVVQEIALARVATVHCGRQIVPWREFRDAVSLFVSRYSDLKKLFQGSKRYNHHPDYLGDITALGANRLCQQASNVFRRADEGGTQAPLMSLEALVSNLSAFEATEPRDVIYSVLALAVSFEYSHFAW
jgi:Heterokaryon incompatibility protein (HET)